MEPFYREFGRRLARARQDSGLSQELLGQRVALSRTSIVNIEKGRQRVPLHMLIEMADALGIASTELLPRKATTGDGASIGLRSVDDDTQAWVLRQIQPEQTYDEGDGA
jgi:transcriptional regulator with XRE-family HTH domain